MHVYFYVIRNIGCLNREAYNLNQTHSHKAARTCCLGQFNSKQCYIFLSFEDLEARGC